MDKNLLICCVAVVCCMWSFSGCEIHNQYCESKTDIAAANAGLEQSMVKADGFQPEYLWVAKE